MIGSELKKKYPIVYALASEELSDEQMFNNIKLD